MLGDESFQVSFCQNHSGLAAQINGLDAIVIWVCEGGEVTEELLDQWLGRGQDSPKALLVSDAKHIPEVEKLLKNRVTGIHAVPKQENQSDGSWVVSTLSRQERCFMLRVGPTAHSTTTKTIPMPTRQSYLLAREL